MTFEAFRRIILLLCKKAGIENPRIVEEDSKQGRRFVAYVGNKIFTGNPASFGVSVSWNTHLAMIPKDTIEGILGEACSA